MTSFPAALLLRSTEIQISRFAGVYLLVHDDEIVYVGQSKDVTARIGGHATRAGGMSFDRAFWLKVPKGDRLTYEGALIRALRPIYNDNAPAYHGRDNEVLIALGMEPHASTLISETDSVTANQRAFDLRCGALPS